MPVTVPGILGYLSPSTALFLSEVTRPRVQKGLLAPVEPQASHFSSRDLAALKRFNRVTAPWHSFFSPWDPPAQTRARGEPTAHVFQMLLYTSHPAQAEVTGFPPGVSSLQGDLDNFLEMGSG